MPDFLPKEFSGPIRRRPTGYARRQNQFYDKPPSHSGGPTTVPILNQPDFRSPSPMDVDPPDVQQGSLANREGARNGFHGQEVVPKSNEEIEVIEHQKNIKLNQLQAEFKKCMEIMTEFTDPPVQLQHMCTMKVLLAATHQEVARAEMSDGR
ncbi:hypothetical protein VKT23_008569 [Stygiomarasmius scandens]|uniref:Uncharacterized protein n=1 Tax=Marasmiellus scandens TaxID=2682957 RepID=A0ABR1JGT8_9AGAR